MALTLYGIKSCVKRPVILRDGAAVQAGFRGTDEVIEARLLR